MIHKRMSKAGKPSWQVKVRESGRGSRTVTRTFSTKAAAQAFERKLLDARELGVHAPGPASRDRLEDWLEVWFTSNRETWARSTVISRASVIDRWIVPYIGGVRLSELGPQRLREWRDAVLADGSTPTNSANVMRVLSAALGAAVDEGKLPANPLASVKKPPTIRRPRTALSPEQAERIRIELPTLRDRVLWGLQYAGGLRTEEALAVRWSDVLDLSPTGGTLAIDRVFVAGEFRDTTKTRTGRDVPIVAPLAADLLDLRAQVGESATVDPEALVCASGRGTPVNPNNWRRRVFDPAATAAGVEWATPYSGRHTYISLQIHAGVSPVTIAAWAGNSPKSIWDHYAREFERSRATLPLPLEDALVAARREVGATMVRPRDPVVVPDGWEGQEKAPR